MSEEVLSVPLEEDTLAPVLSQAVMQSQSATGDKNAPQSKKLLEKCIGSVRMEDYVEQQQMRIPLNKRKWDLDGAKGQSRPLDFDKFARPAQSLRTNPPTRPLSSTVLGDEGMPMR